MYVVLSLRDDDSIAVVFAPLTVKIPLISKSDHYHSCQGHRMEVFRSNNKSFIYQIYPCKSQDEAQWPVPSNRGISKIPEQVESALHCFSLVMDSCDGGTCLNLSFLTGHVINETYDHKSKLTIF